MSLASKGVRARPALVTIITDASFHHPTLSAGYAGRVICDGRRTTYSGMLRGEVTSCNDAEVAAVVNTLHQGLIEGAIPHGSRWIIQVDNLHAMGVLAFRFTSPGRKRPRKSPKTSPMQVKALRVLDGLVKHFKPTDIEFRHVKAHVKRDDREARHHVQEELDKLAKAARWDGVRQRELQRVAAQSEHEALDQHLVPA